MTVQTFIVNYNYTFIYLHERFGKSAVVDLWKSLALHSTFPQREAIRKGGLVGAYEFAYGKDGITAREHVQAKTEYDENHFIEEIFHCPSVNEMVKRNKKRYRYYCEHCYWLYAPNFEDFGFSYDVDYELQRDDFISDHCYIPAYKRK